MNCEQKHVSVACQASFLAFQASFLAFQASFLPFQASSPWRLSHFGSCNDTLEEQMLRIRRYFVRSFLVGKDEKDSKKYQTGDPLILPPGPFHRFQFCSVSDEDPPAGQYTVPRLLIYKQVTELNCYLI